MKFVLPLVMLLIGIGAGVGAGVYMRPSSHEETDIHTEEAPPAEEAHDTVPNEKHTGYGTGEVEYVKLNNQFVVPIVKDRDVAAMVVMSLSIEVPAEHKDTVYKREPKLRDSFLRVLFDHANMGGFEGGFTNAANLEPLRTALREIAQKDMGAEIVRDVLILDIARQDY